MWDFLWANKEWLFSGAGVAIGGGLGALLYRYFLRSEPERPSHITIVQVQEASKQDAVEAQANEPALQLTKVSRIAPLSFNDILEAIEDVPPLQVEATAERFKGVAVQWDAKIFNLHKLDDDNVRVALHFGDGKPGLLYCQVPLAEYRELAYLKRNTPVTVLGVIEEVDDATVTGVTLKDAQLLFKSN